MKELLERNQRKVHLSDLVGKRPIQWPKAAVGWDEAIEGAEVIYEDHAVVAFHEIEDDAAESARETGETRVTVMAKSHVNSLLDLSAADETLSAAMLVGIQQVAYKLGLQNEGFEVRAHVLPPYQRRPGLVFKIRAGKPPKSEGTAS